jgi:transmembrane sensor
MEHHFDIDALIAKRLSAESNAEENAQLEQWLLASPDNQRYFSQMQHLWQQSELGLATLPRTLDVEAALTRTKTRIHPTVPKAKVVPFASWRLAAAAAVAVLLAAVWFFYPENSVQTIEMAAQTNTLQDTLTDGSVIALNQQSSLSATFSQKERRIKMRGEAYFNVAPDKTKPFIIDVKTVAVTVVGTRFNIDNRSDSSRVIVSVEEGKVKVQSGDQVVYLSMGEEASIDCGSGVISRQKLEPVSHVKGWFDRRFVFDDVPLSEVLPIIEKAYYTRIELKNNTLGNCRLRTRFNDESLDRVLELIAETFNLTIENANGRYLLDGAGCQ